MAKISELPIVAGLTGPEALPLVQGAATRQVSLAALVAYMAPLLPGWLKGDKGDAGPASNTRATLAQLKAAAVGDATSLYAGAVWTWEAGDFTGLADDLTVVGSNAVPIANGAWVRAETVRLIDLVPPRLRPAIRRGTCPVDLTPYFNQARDLVLGLPFGGVVELPAGVLRMLMDVSTKVADDARKITIRGAGVGSTVVKPPVADAVVLNMVGRNQARAEHFMIYAGAPGEAFGAYAGVVLCRNAEVGTCNNNKLRHLIVIGNYALAPYVSCGAESGQLDDTVLWPTVDVPAMLNGDDPATMGLAVPGHTLVAGPNTDQRITDVEMYSTVRTGALLKVVGAMSGRISDTTLLCFTTDTLVEWQVPATGAVGGQVKIRGMHYEGLTGPGSTIHRVTGAGTMFLRGVSDTESAIVVSRGAAFLDYDRRTQSTQLVLDACTLRPGRLGDTGQVDLNIHYDFAYDSTIDTSEIGQQGSSRAFNQVGRCRVAGAAFLWNAAATTIAVVNQAAAPASGTYPVGQLIPRSNASAAGDNVGWLTVHGGSYDNDPGGMTVATKAGECKAVLGSAAYGLYVGSRVLVGNYGFTTIRAIDGATVWFANNMVATGSTSINFSGFAGLGGVTARAFGLLGQARLPHLDPLPAGASLAEVVARLELLRGQEVAANVRAG